jgi:hypothetical protein
MPQSIFFAAFRHRNPKDREEMKKRLEEGRALFEQLVEIVDGLSAKIS